MGNYKKTAPADMEELRRLNYKPDDKSPHCDRNCFACTNGRCCILTDNDFGDRECPFFKNWDQCKVEQKTGLEHLIQTGRTDLIDKYTSVMAKLGIFALLDDLVQQMALELGLFEEEDLLELIADMDREEEWLD